MSREFEGSIKLGDALRELGEMVMGKPEAEAVKGLSEALELYANNCFKTDLEIDAGREIMEISTKLYELYQKMIRIVKSTEETLKQTLKEQHNRVKKVVKEYDLA